VLARTFEFEGELLAKAIRTTFAKRATELPAKGIPLAFTPELHTIRARKGSGRRSATEFPPTRMLPTSRASSRRCSFSFPRLRQQLGKETAFATKWKPGGPWQ
jgi:hypothetical protein